MIHTYSHPKPGMSGAVLNWLLNSVVVAKVRRTLMSRIPFLELESDVIDVVYANWLVDFRLASALAPTGARLVNWGGKTPLTILTYRHGNFGPRMARGLRRLLPSPLQSNWRLYLAEPLLDAPAKPTVAFTHNVINNPIHVIGTRLFSDVLPSHLPARFQFVVSEQQVTIDIEPGIGSAPCLNMKLDRQGDATLPRGWQEVFCNWDVAVATLASQDAAVVEFPECTAGMTGVAFSEIELPVDVQSVEPLTANQSDIICPLLQKLKAEPHGLFFRLPRVRFAALSERVLRTPITA